MINAIAQQTNISVTLPSITIIATENIMGKITSKGVIKGKCENGDCSLTLVGIDLKLLDSS